MKVFIFLLATFAVASASVNFFFNEKYGEEMGQLGKGCCVPKQWEGRVGTFYMRKKFLRPVIRMADSKVGIDYKGKKVGARSMFYCRKNKKVYTARSIADFKAKKVYAIFNKKCRVYKLNATMQNPCIPDSFKQFSSYSYGAGKDKLQLIPYGLRNKRLEYFLVVTKGSCVPIKGAFRTRRGKRTLSFGKYQYYNITQGNHDKELYKVPSICKKKEDDEEDDEPSIWDKFQDLFTVSNDGSVFSDYHNLYESGDQMMSHVANLITANGIMGSCPSFGRKWSRKFFQWN